MTIIFFAHLFACGFLLVHFIEVSYGQHNTWVYYYSFNPDNNLELYINSLYYIVITMITVGYGDIHPVNNAEKLFIIVICLVSCTLFAYILSSIGQIIEKIT